MNVPKLKTHFASLERGKAAQIAKEMEVSPSYLSQMVAGTAPISPARAVLFEQLLGGAVTRKDIYPNDWHLIWPELIACDPSDKQEKAAA